MNILLIYSYEYFITIVVLSAFAGGSMLTVRTRGMRLRSWTRPDIPLTAASRLFLILYGSTLLTVTSLIVLCMIVWYLRTFIMRVNTSLVTSETMLLMFLTALCAGVCYVKNRWVKQTVQGLNLQEFTEQEAKKEYTKITIREGRAHFE